MPLLGDSLDVADHAITLQSTATPRNLL